MKVLFISHDASRTGAPLLLLWLVTWLKVNKGVQPMVLLMADGALVKDFHEVAETLLWNRDFRSYSFFEKQLSRFKGFNLKSKNENQVVKKIKRFDPDVLYFNTVACSNLIPEFKKIFGKKVILHVHELESIIQQINLDNSFTRALAFTDHFIAVSQIVEKNLVINHGVQQNKTAIVYEYIDFDKYAPLKRAKNDDKFRIGGGGLVHWRKGVGFFIAVAHYFKRHYPSIEIEFWWTGKIARLDQIYFEQDLVKLDLTDVVFFKGEVLDISEQLNKLDIFLVTSREDPFPVIAIEAAYHSIPIISWNQAIGTKEMIDEGCGTTVDYMDFDAMANAIFTMLNDQHHYKILAENAFKISSNYSIDKAGNKIFTLINNI